MAETIMRKRGTRDPWITPREARSLLVPVIIGDVDAAAVWTGTERVHILSAVIDGNDDAHSMGALRSLCRAYGLPLPVADGAPSARACLFAERLAFCMDALSLDKSEVVQRTGFTPQAVDSWLTASRQSPWTSSMNRMAKTLGVPPKDLYESKTPSQRLVKDIVKRAMRASGHTVMSLADRCGTAPATMKALIDGRCPVPLGTLDSISGVLGVAPSAMCEGMRDVSGEIEQAVAVLSSHARHLTGSQANRLADAMDTWYRVNDVSVVSLVGTGL